MVMVRRFLPRKLKGPAPIIVGSLMLILSYQNFSPHDAQMKPIIQTEKLLPEFSPRHERKLSNEVNEGSENQAENTQSYRDLQNSNLISLNAIPKDRKSNHFDIRDYAPNRPDHVAFNEDPFRAPEMRPTENAQPRMIDAGSAWLDREVRPLVKPLEEEWLNKVNGQLRGLFGSFKPVDGEDWPEPGQDGSSSPRGPASVPGAFPGMPDIPGMPDFQGVPGSESGDNSEDDYLSLKTITPEEVKLTKANEVTFSFKHGTSISCEISSGQSKLRLLRPVSRSSSFDISHESAENRNSVGFRLSW